ncbi:MAG: glycine cleavage system aminomethyltransferase GcvT [Nitrospira sp.]|nr:glycine cleavage system aminomethyltransferase GcvT [Nitrospira sp.]
MQQTPLIAQHRAAGAKLVTFAGWEMPLQYSGVVDEYQAVRTQAGLFDVSHMGRLMIEGPSAGPFLETVTTNNIAALEPWRAHYSMVCNYDGGIKDDVFVYRLGDCSAYLLCVNAANREKVLSWLLEHVRHGDDCRVRDRSGEIAQIALQGPATREIVAALGVSGLETLKPRESRRATVGGVPCLVARTGYTGEFGYEFYVWESPVQIWTTLLEKGRPFGVKPAGLGARDLLRLEMGYLLYGHDIDEGTTPLEAGVEWAVDFAKGTFIGRDVLWAQKQVGPARRLIGFELREKAVPRQGFAIFDGTAATVIGTVTSGNFSPLLQKGIGMGYVSSAHAAPGTTIVIDIRGKMIPATVVKPPFYRKASRFRQARQEEHM